MGAGGAQRAACTFAGDQAAPPLSPTSAQIWTIAQKSQEAMPERLRSSQYQPVARGQRTSVGESRTSYGSHRRPADRRDASSDSRADARINSEVSSDDGDTTLGESISL